MVSVAFQNNSIRYMKGEVLNLENKNLRASQIFKKNKQGMVTDTYINNKNKADISTTNTPLPEDLVNKDENKKNKSEKTLLSALAVPLGVLGIGAAVTGIMAGICKGKLNTAKAFSKFKLFKPDKNVPPLPRNINIQTEEQFVTYTAVRDPSVKNILGATAVFAFSAAAFTMKNTVDGIKEIWVKKQEADIKRDFQEKMIDIETRSFSGKKQIVRHLLEDKKIELDGINKEKNISFAGNKKPEKDTDKGIKASHAVIGGIAVAAAVFLIKKTAGNIRKIGQEMEKFVSKTKKGLDDSLKTVTEKNVNPDKIAKTFSDLKLSDKEVEKSLKLTKLQEKTKQTIIKKVRENNSPFADAHEMYGKGSKITFFTYINDVSGHLYNLIVHPSKFTASLFGGLTAVTGAGYAGSKFVEAKKEAHVKKADAEINLDMHDKLVRVELKNFLKKKETAVDPLVETYKTYADEPTKDKNKLKFKYNAVVDEIKNGPPFIYD